MAHNDQEKNPLEGLWKLLSFSIQDESADKQYPLGHDPIGYVNYLPNKFMMMHMGMRNRPRVAADSPLDLQLSNALLEMVKTYVGYCGTYEIQGNHVYHHIDLAFFPNWTGQSVEREFKIDNNFLKLTDRLIVAGQKYIFDAHWEKVKTIVAIASGIDDLLF